MSNSMQKNGKGRLYVIEGLDGSGKATQSELLYESFVQRGLPVRKVSFPNYESDSSALVRMYLRGDFGSDPSDVNAYAASSFYAADRFVFALSKEENRLFAPELLGNCPDPGSIAAALGKASVTLRTPGIDPFAMFLPLTAQTTPPEYSGIALD